MPIPDKLSPPAALKRLQALVAQNRWDIEASHLEADRVLLALLRYYGQDEIVEAFNAVEKWYA